MGQVEAISWFPGHMAKAIRQIQSELKLVDAAIEIVDARVPMSSKNPDASKIMLGKPVLTILNKSDLANQSDTEQWIKYYENSGKSAMAVSCNSAKWVPIFKKRINQLLKDKVERWKTKGIKNKTIRVIVLGEPNTGKSTFINRAASSVKVKAENRPGITKVNQWISIDKTIEMLDTPGVLPPKIKGEKAQSYLAFTGAIKDEVLNIENIALNLLDFLIKNYPEKIEKRYKLENQSFNDKQAYEVLNIIGRKRGFLTSGGDVDILRVSNMVLSEFRAGKIGQITLEKAEDFVKTSQI